MIRKKSDNKRDFLILIAITTLVLLQPQISIASSCNVVETSNIHFKKGEKCWRYEGTKNQFVGKFGGRQKITVTMFGLAAYATEGGGIEKRWEPRSPSVSGPNGFFEMDSAGTGKLVFMTQSPGKYTFDFGPCAMWGGYGETEICAY